MPFSIERNDLARMRVDAVVVPANELLRIDGGFGRAVALAAGLEQVQVACDELGGCATGDAVATPGFALPARTIVHAVGPVWPYEGAPEAQVERARALLRSAYDRALAVAWDAGARTVGLPLISAHTFRCPAEVSFALCVEAVRAFVDEHDADVRIVLFDRAAVAAALGSYEQVAAFVDDAYAAAHDPAVLFEGDAPLGAAGSASAPNAVPMAAPAPRGRLSERLPWKRARADRAVQADARAAADEAAPAPAPTAPAPPPAAFGAAPPHDLAALLDRLDAPFSTTLLALIDARGLTDAQVYKRANMSRQLFSKIRSDAAYRPTKRTVLALAVALRLTLPETEDLLRRAGFALSRASKADVIVEFFIRAGSYDIFEINEALFAFDQPLL